MDNHPATFTNNSDNYINTLAFFGGVRRTIITKNFKGGTIYNLFGGTILDFTYADLTGTAVLDITQAFGETQIIVPSKWRVEAHASHFCSVVDDKRDKDQEHSTDKVLVIKGLSVFAVVNVLNLS